MSFIMPAVEPPPPVVLEPGQEDKVPVAAPWGCVARQSAVGEVHGFTKRRLLPSPWESPFIADYETKQVGGGVTPHTVTRSCSGHTILTHCCLRWVDCRAQITAPKKLAKVAATIKVGTVDPSVSGSNASSRKGSAAGGPKGAAVVGAQAKPKEAAGARKRGKFPRRLMRRRESIEREARQKELEGGALEHATLQRNIQPPQRHLYLLPNPYQLFPGPGLPKYPFQPPPPPQPSTCVSLWLCRLGPPPPPPPSPV